MQKIEDSPEYRIEMGVDGDDQTMAVEPPVDIRFREQMYDILDELGLLKEIVVRGGNFFETKHLTNGTPYSELRVSSTALGVVGKRMAAIAHMGADILREQGHKAQVSPYIIAAGGSRRHFEDVKVQEERPE